MATRMTINGVSTCTEVGTEKYERFQSGIGRRRRTLVQYDYRHTDEELFACVKSTLDECREARDKWLNEKAGKEDRR
jgi:peptidyl-tRNA hydrolase